MATDYNPVAGTVPDGFCPTTYQQVLNQFASLLTITINDASTVSIGDSSPADLTKLWIKTSVSEPYVLGAFVYSGGAWRRVPGHSMYFADTGSANAITITTTESLNSSTLVSGRLFLIRVNATNTGATTIAVDSFAAKALRKNNDTVLSSGDIEAGQIIAVAFDSTADQWELVTTLPAAESDSPTYETTAEDTFPAGGASVALTHTRNKIPEWVRCVAVCQVATNGYARGDEIDIGAMGADISGGSDVDAPLYAIIADQSSITVSAMTANGEYYPAKAGGQADWAAARPNFKVKAYIMALP